MAAVQQMRTIRFAQSPTLGRKVSDEFTVPLCRGHHREVHIAKSIAAAMKPLGGRKPVSIDRQRAGIIAFPSPSAVKAGPKTHCCERRRLLKLFK